MSRNLIEIIIDLKDNASDKAKGLQKDLKSLGSDMTKIGVGMTAGFTAPIVAGFTAAVIGASDLNEAVSKSAFVFGENAAAVREWASTSAQSMGISQKAALDTAGTYGNIITNMGLTKDAAAQMSMSLIQLASDQASFNNLKPEEVHDKIRAAMVGEYEGVKSLGMVLNDTIVKQRALAMTGKETADELTNAELVQARYALIMEQSATVAGDFARTSDGLANSQRILSATLQDALATLGTQLIPIVTQVVSTVNDWLTKFKELSPTTQKVILIVGGIVAAIGPLLMIVGSVISAISAIAPVIGVVVGLLSGPVLLVIGLVVGAIALLYAAWKNNWGGIQEKTKAVVDWIKTTIQTFVDAVKGFWADHGEKIMAVVRTTWEYVRSQIQRVVDLVKAIISGDWRRAGELVREIWENAWSMLAKIVSAAWTGITEAVKGLISKVVTIFRETDWVQLGKDIIQGVINGLLKMDAKVRETMLGILKSGVDFIKGFFGIQSPSKLMASLGVNVMEGFNLGMKSAGSRTPDAMLQSAVPAAVNNTYNTFNVTAQYAYQSPGAVMDDIRRLNAIYGR